jgi:hypothetical protein
MQTELANELMVQFLGVTLSARGLVALMMAAPVALLILALAWRVLTQGTTVAAKTLSGQS